MASTNNAKDRVLFTAKNFTLQEVTIALRGNADERPVYFDMLPNYIIDNVGAKSVAIKTLYNEKMPAYYTLKHNLKQLYCRWFLLGDEVLTPSGTLQKPCVELLCQWTKAMAADLWMQKVL
jgi:hypothetical protein